MEIVVCQRLKARPGGLPAPSLVQLPRGSRVLCRAGVGREEQKLVTVRHTDKP